MEYVLFGKKRYCNLIEYPKDFKMTRKHENTLKILLDILRLWNKEAEKMGVDWWVDGGTLLGVVRHNGFIPWDDDADICVPFQFYEKIKNYSGVLDIQESVCGFKIRFPKTIYPFMDIFLVDKQENNYKYCAPIIFGEPTFKIQKIYEKFNTPINLVYPIRKALFENICVNIPNNPRELVLLNYGKDCLTHGKSWNQFYHRIDVEKIDKIAMKVLPALDIFEKITKKEDILIPVIKKIMNH